jgi:hypothetical protein
MSKRPFRFDFYYRKGTRVNRSRSLPILLLAASLVSGCSASQATDPEARYRKALAETAASAPVQEGSAVEERAIQDFVDFYKTFSADTVRAKVREVYAPEAYFRDPFHEVSGIDAIEKYFVASTETIQQCTFDMEDVARHRRNYYFRWTMHLKTKRDPEHPIESIGITHVRFDDKGRVVFHQDYWDAGTVVYEKIPVLGSLVRFVKARIRGD